MDTIRAFLRRRGWLLALGVLAAGYFFVSQVVCVGALFRYGVALEACPDGTPGQELTLFGEGLLRGATGRLSLAARARYVDADGRERSEPFHRYIPTITLVDDEGKETPLQPSDGWKEVGDQRQTGVALPPVADGDYRLRASVESPFGTRSVDLALPLYAAARAHVITDRPLYRPGDTLQFRALAVRATDLTPLDHRPGVWLVKDPSGEVLLEERGDAGAFGVARGSFPLHPLAASGTWTVAWRSGGMESATTVTVEPFQLPRFRVDTSSPKASWRAGEKPTLEGRAVYSSGANVRDAAVAITWQIHGAWPAPLDWKEGLLPRAARTDGQGKFTLALPQVPYDLRGQVTLGATIAVTDDTGDRLESSASVLLVEERISVSAVTELAGGLVEGFNNRLFVRLTTAEGTPLPGASLTLRRSWDPADKGLTAITDEDAVASFQVDPGPAVNVVVPPMPYRPPPVSAAKVSPALRSLVPDHEPSLADQRRLEEFAPRFASCARFVDEGERRQVDLGLELDVTGKVVEVAREEEPLSRCVGSLARALAFNPGQRRTFGLRVSISGAALPTLAPRVEGAPLLPAAVEDALTIAAYDARECLPDAVTEGEFPQVLLWRYRKGAASLGVSATPAPSDESLRLNASVVDCVTRKFANVAVEPRLDGEEAQGDALGAVWLHVTPRLDTRSIRPQATTFLGYEFEAVARRGDAELGKAKLRLTPGRVPPLRLRAEPSIAKPGDTVQLTLLRGPGFTGEPPDKLFAHSSKGDPVELEVDAKKRGATWTVPAGAEGWVELSSLAMPSHQAATLSGYQTFARSFVFVKPSASLTVELAPERKTYAPGELARLQVFTREGSQGVPAAVGLFGVDASLSQLVSLPGPDQLEALRPTASTGQKAFGLLDGAALAAGRIRGANASAATVLQISALPDRAGGDAPIHASAQALFDPNADLVDRFFLVASELQTRLRAWEQQAKSEELASPALVARLWNESLAACLAKGEKVEDGYGRPLRLSQLPPDLLALVDPRNLVSSGTRLPEDVEDWAAWVAEEVP